MAFINDSLVFLNPAAITAMPENKLSNGMFYACTDLGAGIPGWYQYQSASIASLDPPNVIDCTNGTGRFVLFGGQASGSPGGGSIEYIKSDSVDPLDPPTYDGTSGLSFYIRENSGPSQVYFFDIYIGVDTTGDFGTNGWQKIQNA